VSVPACWSIGRRGCVPGWLRRAFRGDCWLIRRGSGTSSRQRFMLLCRGTVRIGWHGRGAQSQQVEGSENGGDVPAA
jgi:hypothetical protein